MQTTLTNSAQIDYEYSSGNEIIEVNTQTNTVSTTVMTSGLNILSTASRYSFGPNERILFYIFLSNSQNTAVTNITISYPLPNEISYVQDSSNLLYSDGTIKDIEDTNNTNSKNLPISGFIIPNEDLPNKFDFGFKIGNLDPSQSVLISFAADIKNSDSLPEILKTTATTTYNVVNCEKSTLVSNEIILSKAYSLISATKTVNKETVCCGNELKYDIILNNSGNLSANNVRIYDSLPKEFNLSKVSCIISGITTELSYSIDDSNNLIIPASENEKGFTIPANSSDNIISLYGTIK